MSGGVSKLNGACGFAESDDAAKPTRLCGVRRDHAVTSALKSAVLTLTYETDGRARLITRAGAG